jgi:hypothetical protein
MTANHTNIIMSATIATIAMTSTANATMLIRFVRSRSLSDVLRRSLSAMAKVDLHVSRPLSRRGREGVRADQALRTSNRNMIGTVTKMRSRTIAAVNSALCDKVTSNAIAIEHYGS